MTEKYTLEQVKENLEKLYDRLKLRGREKGFWVIASRSDFKPIKLRETIKGKEIDKTIVKINDIKNELLEGKEQYFKGKKLAFINFYIDKIYLNDPKEYNENRIDKIKNVILCAITIDIYVVDKDGKIDTFANNEWRAKINFTVDDMINHRLKLKDAEKLMRQVAEKIVTTSNFTGIFFKDYVKLYTKKLNKLSRK